MMIVSGVVDRLQMRVVSMIVREIVERRAQAEPPIPMPGMPWNSCCARLEPAWWAAPDRLVWWTAINYLSARLYDTQSTGNDSRAEWCPHADRNSN